jgi:hypothetical protein
MNELLLIIAYLLLIAAGYGLLAIAAHYWSLTMIFPRPPVQYELTPDYLQLTTPDGVTLAARHWPNPEAKYTLLYLHGNYEDLGSVEEYLPQFVQDGGFAVFAVDYRRYGRSGGVPTEANVCADVRLAFDHLRDKMGVPADRIIIFGYSLGGGPAVDLALHRPAAGLVLQGAFVSTYRVMTRVPLFPGDKFVNLPKMPRLRMPVYVIHGMADRTVPFWHAEALFAAITTRKMKFFVPDGPHTRLGEFVGPSYWVELRKFTDSL